MDLIGKKFTLYKPLHTVCNMKEKKKDPTWNGCLINSNSIIEIIRWQRKKTKIYFIHDCTQGGFHICKQSAILESIKQ